MLGRGREQVAMLNRGEIPIYEPALEAMVKHNVAAGRLHFTTDVAASVAHGAVQFIAVGTPPDEDGFADLQYVAAAQNIGRHMDDYKMVVDKSTVPVGMGEAGRQMIRGELSFERFIDRVVGVLTSRVIDWGNHGHQ